MTAALCESKAYFHPVIWSIITQRLFALSSNPKDIVLLWLFIVPASLIPNTTSSVCTCYIFTGNSSERQRQTWAVEMTRSQRFASVCFARGCEAYRKQRCKMQAQWQVITPAVERTIQSTAKLRNRITPAATRCSTYTDLHGPSSHVIQSENMRRPSKGRHLSTTTVYFSNSRNTGGYLAHVSGAAKLYHQIWNSNYTWTDLETPRCTRGE